MGGTLSLSAVRNLHREGKIYNSANDNKLYAVILRTQLLPRQTQGPYLAALCQVFPSICFPCAQLPWGPSCSTHSAGPKPEMGIYASLPPLFLRQMWVLAKTVVLATCGGDWEQSERWRGRRKHQIYSSTEQEIKLLFCLEASILMLKGIFEAYKLQRTRNHLGLHLERW